MKPADVTLSTGRTITHRLVPAGYWAAEDSGMSNPDPMTDAEWQEYAERVKEDRRKALGQL